MKAKVTELEHKIQVLSEETPDRGLDHPGLDPSKTSLAILTACYQTTLNHLALALTANTCFEKVSQSIRE